MDKCRLLQVKILFCLLALTACFAELNAQDVRTGYLMVRMRQATTVQAAQDAIPIDFTVTEQLLDPSRTVFFKDNNAQVVMRRGGPKQPDLYSAEWRLVRTFAVRFESPVHPSRAAQTLQSKYGHVVEYAEPWYTNVLHGVPNDPLVINQDHLTTIRAFPGWDIYKGDSSMIIGIVDNGVTQGHEDLLPNIAPNRGEIPNNGIDDDNNGYIDDAIGCNLTSSVDGTLPGNTTNNSVGGHGTSVAGIASAATNNSKGIAGVGYNSRFFPIKAAPIGSGSILYGYQGILYSVQRGFKVVNTSWGRVKPPSPIDISVIDYCLANDVLVVASAGNHGDGFSGAGWKELNYPAAYEGVMGVGESTKDDFVMFTSGLGANAVVMAPGNNSLTTNASGGYDQSGSGTSFAAPMGAGLAALVRSKWPALTPLQTIAHILETSDDISAINTGYGAAVPGRINMLRALQTEPFSQPSIRVARSVNRLSGDRDPSRFYVGDTLNLAFDLINDLGLSEPLTVSLRIFEESGWTVEVLDAQRSVPAIASGTTARTPEFKVIVNIIGEQPLIFRLDIEGGAYLATRLEHLSPPAYSTDFSNDRIAYTMVDDGNVGYASRQNTLYGIGFNWKNLFSVLAPSGFLLSEGADRAVGGFANIEGTKSDFFPVKPFAGPQPETNIMSDDRAGNRKIGVRVTQKCTFPSLIADATIISVRIQNSSGGALQDLAAGYMLDWDIGSGGSNNTTRLAPEAIPDHLRGANTVAQLFSRSGEQVFICHAAVGGTPGAVGQSAGIKFTSIVNDPDGFTDADRIRLLSSGTSMQELTEGDLCGVIGMRFPGITPNDESVAFTVVIGVGSTAREATEAVRLALGGAVDVHEQSHQSVLLIAPNPTASRAVVTHKVGAQRITVRSVTGAVALFQECSADGITILNTESLASGLYSISIDHTTYQQRGVLSVLR